MEDSTLTNMAIAELMRGPSGMSNKEAFDKQERKVNPLGKPNNRFLGRTINNVMRHNKRETERTQASCQKKLKELDDRYKQRQRNVFYNRNARETLEGREHKSRSQKKRHKRRRRSTSSSSDSRIVSRSSSRHRSRDYKRKRRKHTRKESKKRRHTSSESSGKEPTTTTATPNSEYYMYSSNLALAVAMAYNQACTQQPQAQQPHPPLPASPSSDIIRELMFEDESIQQPKVQCDALSIASSTDDDREILTINLSSQDEQSADSSESESESSSGSCISLTDSVEDDLVTFIGSDIETVNSKSEQLKDAPLEWIQLSDEDVQSKTNTVDLTED